MLLTLVANHGKLQSMGSANSTIEFGRHFNAHIVRKAVAKDTVVSTKSKIMDSHG